MSIDQIMIQCASPSLCKIKPANLFSIQTSAWSQEKLSAWRKEFAAQGITFSLLRSTENSFLAFVYNFEWIQALLAASDARRFLALKNYPVQEGARAVLNELLFRLNQASKKGEKKFPHEVGLFLGYPLSDVAAFESRKGQGATARGCWKSYSNCVDARRTWELYKNCAKFFEERFKSGRKIQQIVREFKSLNKR